MSGWGSGAVPHVFLNAGLTFDTRLTWVSGPACSHPLSLAFLRLLHLVRAGRWGSLQALTGIEGPAA